MANRKNLAECFDGDIQKVVDAIEAAVTKVADGCYQVGDEALDEYAAKAEKMEAAEKAMHEADAEVSNSKSGRDRNVRAISSAMLDDDQDAIEAAQTREKQRKKDLAAAETVLEKAKAEYAATKIDRYAEASAAGHVAGRADRTREAVLQKLKEKVEATIKTSVKGANVPRPESKAHQDAKRLYPKGQRVDSPEWEHREQTREDWKQRYRVA